MRVRAGWAFIVFPADAGMNRQLDILHRARNRVFPADAGMNRNPHGAIWGLMSVPRRRGDEPNYGIIGGSYEMCSPQTRGGTGTDTEVTDQVEVFPADAGMNRKKANRHCSTIRVPRRRGDEP